MDLFWETFLVVVFLIVAHLGIYSYLSKKKPKNIKDRHVVVTGGSSGIGLSIAIHAAKLGANVTIIARNIGNLGELNSLCWLRSADKERARKRILHATNNGCIVFDKSPLLFRSKSIDIFLIAFIFPESAIKQIEASRVSEQQKIQYRSIDLSASYDHVAKALTELEESIGSIYWLVNCAGMAVCIPSIQFLISKYLPTGARTGLSLAIQFVW